MSKSADAFRTISEVADWLGVQAHVLRFWESKFSQIKPVKRAGGRRYYRPADMLLLGGIQKLLHEDGLSIKEVQTILRDLGIAHVSQLSHDLDADGPPAHRNTSREASKKSSSAKHIPEDASATETVSTDTDPVDASLQHDPAAAAHLSTPSPSITDLSQENSAQDVPVEPNELQEIATEPPAPDDSDLTQTSAFPEEALSTTAHAPSAEMSSEDVSVSDPADAAGLTSADTATAIQPDDPTPVQPVAEPPVSPAPAQLDMALDTPVDASPVEAAAPAEPVAEEPTVATMPSQDEISEVSTPELAMTDADVAPVEDAMQLDTQPETETIVSPASAAENITAAPAAASEGNLASTEADQTLMAETTVPASSLPDEPVTDRTDTPSAEAGVAYPTEQSAELGAIQSLEAPDLETLPGAALSAETPQFSEMHIADATMSPDRSQNILSLLEKTTVLPTHIQADVANCADELRALLAAR